MLASRSDRPAGPRCGAAQRARALRLRHEREQAPREAPRPPQTATPTRTADPRRFGSCFGTSLGRRGGQRKRAPAASPPRVAGGARGGTVWEGGVSAAWEMYPKPPGNVPNNPTIPTIPTIPTSPTQRTQRMRVLFWTGLRSLATTTRVLVLLSRPEARIWILMATSLLASNAAVDNGVLQYWSVSGSQFGVRARARSGRWQQLLEFGP
eukprot:gene12581-biopygen10776